VTFARRTVKRDVVFKGRGLHSGMPVEVRVRAASTGIRFACGNEQTRAVPENVTDTSRCTKLGAISTVEHMMSALAGLGITDVDVELTAPELPADDGSSVGFVGGLMAAGYEELGQARVSGPFARVFTNDQKAKIAISAGNGHWRYDFKSGNRWPHSQSHETLQVCADYIEQIAPARTFGFEEDLPAIREAGLAQGLDLTTALVLGQTGYRNPPLFPDEPARHKMLDLIGDLALAGVPIQFLNVTAERSGHRLNVQAAAMLARSVSIEVL
jgi:UDP-3-O-[3-hydroxymyristoyl] N-acetylglucosamine deacetylase